MAAGMTQTPFAPDQEGHILDEQGSIQPNYLQKEWGYVEDADHPIAPSDALCSSGDAPIPFTPEEFSSICFQDFGPSRWAALLDDTNTVPYVPPVWPTSPMDTLSHNPWGPADQPFPSPVSEAASYAFTMSPYGMDGTTGYPTQSSRSGTNSPATATNPALPTPLPQPGDHLVPTTKSLPKNPHPAPKRPAESAPRPPRPRTLKRHRSDTPSIASIASISTTGSASTVGSAATTLGGVLPANMDPRVASEQIRREAWERCKAEAFEMSQRRMMLQDHEHGALERETQRLQVNLGLMREAAKREQADLEEDEARARRAEK